MILHPSPVKCPVNQNTEKKEQSTCSDMNTNNKPANYLVINYLAALQCGPLDQRTENNRPYYASANNCALDLLKSMTAAWMAFCRAAKKEN